MEVLRDVIFRLAPVSTTKAFEMIQATRSHKLLEGVRGMPVADQAAIAEVIQRVAQAAAHFPELSELDINPLLACPEGCLAVDARVTLHSDS